MFLVDSTNWWYLKIECSYVPTKVFLQCTKASPLWWGLRCQRSNSHMVTLILGSWTEMRCPGRILETEGHLKPWKHMNSLCEFSVLLVNLLMGLRIVLFVFAWILLQTDSLPSSTLPSIELLAYVSRSGGWGNLCYGFVSSPDLLPDERLHHVPWQKASPDRTRLRTNKTSYRQLVPLTY